MPLVKIHVDAAIPAADRRNLADNLPSLRDLICRVMEVDASICQFAIVTIDGLPDQTLIATELHIMPKAERTRAYMLDVCEQVRAAILELTSVRSSVRVFSLDPETYIALR